VTKQFKHQYRTDSFRLKTWDYSKDGAYFITVCTHQRGNLFGEIINETIQLNQYGKIVQDEWIKSERIRTEIQLDEFIIMPNHFHAIVWIKQSVETTGQINNVETTGRSSLQEHPKGPMKKSLGSLIAGFKSSVTVKINHLRQTPNQPVWQRNYYDRIIRHERELREIRNYIKFNVFK
jgi:putative transposase